MTVIVADSSAMVALIDRRDHYHLPIKKLFEDRRDDWVVPWAILPEVDYLVAKTVNARTAQIFLTDVAAGAYQMEWGGDADVRRASELNRQYADLELGLVDAVVMAIAERLEAWAIATFDRRHFGAVTLRRAIELLPHM